MESRECEKVRELVFFKICIADDSERGEQRRARVDSAIVDSIPNLCAMLEESAIRG